LMDRQETGEATLLRRVSWLIRHVYQQRIAQPRRSRRWGDLDKSFVHRARGGLRFRLQPPEHIDRFIYVEGIYERRFLDLVKSHLPSGAVVIDVGANIGNHAVYLSDACAEIHCFEPNPTVVERLRENLRLNEIDNAHVHPVGLSDQNAELHFAVDHDGNLGASHFVEEPTAGTTRLPVVVGDDYLRAIEVHRVDS